MELKDFIVQTIVDIDTACTEIKEKTTRCPFLASDKSHASSAWVISFDLMVTGETKTDGKVSVGINVLWMQLWDTWMSWQSTSSNSSRIKFALHY